MAKKLAVGLDIGTSAVKMVQLREAKRGYQLVNFGVEPLPQQAIVDGAIMSSSAVVEAIKRLRARLGNKNKSVAMAVAGHSVIIKKISLPAMSDEELEEQLQWEAEQHIPFDINDVFIAGHPVKRAAGESQMDVLLVAAKKDMINDHTAVAREAGLEPVVVDVAAFAVQNTFESAYGLPKNETVALINAGASSCNINVIADEVPSFTRDIATGGNKLTEEIQKQLNVSFEEAEAYKVGGDHHGDAEGVVPQEVDAALNREAQAIAGEIQRSLDFYAHTSPDGAYSHIYLSGGTARVQALVKAIEQRAHVAVTVLDAFRGLQIDETKYPAGFLRANAPLAAVAVGLALRYANDVYAAGR
ncbi:MAG TPA: type IV pilus assembly protein PilM [Myxococcota bacterium]|jgi:type IV pilus assembly protein PilM|nr:type IV pilus assembly protein PilM [Myxococcota bacterium]